MSIKLVQDFLLPPSPLILPALSMHIDHLLRTSVDWYPRRQSHGGGAGLDFIPVPPRFTPQLCCVLREFCMSNHCFYILNFKRVLQDESRNICILETFQKSTKWCLACGKLDVRVWKIIFVEATLSYLEQIGYCSTKYPNNYLTFPRSRAQSKEKYTFYPVPRNAELWFTIRELSHCSSLHCLGLLPKSTSQGEYRQAVCAKEKVQFGKSFCCCF